MMGDELVPIEVWGTAQYGLLHPPPVEDEGVTREQAEKRANEGYMCTPIRRRVVMIDGVEYGSAWMRVPTAAQRVENPKWPEEVAL